MIPAIEREQFWWRVGTRAPLAVAFWILLAAPPSTMSQGMATRGAEAVGRVESSGRPFGAKFSNVAKQAGLDMRFTFGGEREKRYIIEANGTGVAFIDYDADGWLDIFLVNGSKLEGFGDGPKPTSKLYRNKRDGTFEDATVKAGVGRHGWGGGVCGGDYDNDGDLDMFVGYWGPSALYRNSGDGVFDEVAAKAGVAGPASRWDSGCSFVDYDRDGLLDLFVSQYQEFDIKTAAPPGKESNCQWKGQPVFCGPRGLPFGGVTLYRNRGDGTFEDVTETSGVGEPEGFYGFTVVANDLDADSWTDIYVACDSTPNLFFLNNGDGSMADFAAETGLAFNEHGFEQGGMGVGVGDFDNDGLLDLIKTNFAGDYPNLYRNDGDGIFEDVVIRAGMAINPQYVGWGVDFVDLDNDGWEDVFQVNGHVYPELDEQTKTNETYRQTNLVYRNLGNGKFEDVTELAGAGVQEKKSSRGAAFGDFDNDGDLDAVVMNMGEGPSLLRNDLSSDNHWLRVQLQGTKSNRSAVGATVIAHAGEAKQAAAVVSQSSYISHSDLRVHFGLGAAQRLDKIEVRWPSGDVEEFPAAAAGQTILLVEGSGAVKPLEAQ